MSKKDDVEPVIVDLEGIERTQKDLLNEEFLELRIQQYKLNLEIRQLIRRIYYLKKKYGDDKRKKLEKYDLNKLPIYIQENKDKLKEWID